MALALLANTAPRIVAILGANPSAWSSTVSGNVGAFPSDAEITAATIEADGDLITRGYFNSINNTLAQPFMGPSEVIPPGGEIPYHQGNIGRVEVARAVYAFTTLNVNTGTDLITIPTHTIVTGAPVTVIGEGTPTAVPAPLVEGTTYYAIVVSSTTIKLAETKTNAHIGIPINLTNTGGSDGMYIVEWQGGIEARHIDDIKNAMENANSYVQTDALNFLWKIDNGCLWHSAAYGRVEIPSFTRTAALQAKMEHEPIIIGLAVKLLTKNASPALFAEWAAIGENGIQSIIRDGSYQPTNPDVNL